MSTDIHIHTHIHAGIFVMCYYVSFLGCEVCLCACASVLAFALYIICMRV